jgi:DNA-binding response OmpR family regulator
LTLLRKVLIVEDDLSTRELLVAVVARHSCDSVQCGDGRSAEALLQSYVYDAILLDLILPEVSGFDVLVHLGAHDRSMLARVVVITAASPSLFDECAEMNDVQAVIRKPFDLIDVDDALARCWA